MTYDRDDYLYLTDALRKGDVILFSDLDNLIVWAEGTTLARVYAISGPAICFETECFSWDYRPGQLQRVAAEAATKEWVDARDEAREELYSDFVF